MIDLSIICWILSVTGKQEGKNQCEKKQNIEASKNGSNFPCLGVNQNFQSRTELKISEIESQRMGKMKNSQKSWESKLEWPTPRFTH